MPATEPLVEPIKLRHPFWRYVEMFDRDEHAFLLDSANDDLKLGRFSFLGGDPFVTFEARRSEPRDVDPFRVLTDLLALHRPRGQPQNHGDVPFLGGAVGYVGYEAAGYIEDVPSTGAPLLVNLPDMYFMFPGVVLAEDRASGETYLSLHDATRLEEVRARISAFEPLPRGPMPTRNVITSAFDAATYGALVERIKEHIRAGDVFEVCVTRQLEAKFEGDAWELYRTLRALNPAPFAAYLRFPSGAIVSSSPERFLRLDAQRIAESRPIKGTCPRGATAEEDERLRKALATSVKDISEHDMIVDLVRSDLGRVCRIGTVQVAEHRVLEPYAAVHQMVSTIRGELAPDKAALDLVKACFPGGSMTGAPKIAAMKIIDRLEPSKRGPYSGALGYIDFSGTMDLSIVIRAFIVQAGQVAFGTGGAIVADSDAKIEYEETEHKAKPLLRALGSS